MKKLSILFSLTFICAGTAAAGSKSALQALKKVSGFSANRLSRIDAARADAEAAFAPQDPEKRRAEIAARAALFDAQLDLVYGTGEEVQIYRKCSAYKRGT